MNLHIEWTPIAQQSLREVYIYTMEKFGRRQLLKLTSKIYAATRRIAAMPESGKREAEMTDATGVEYRSTIVIKELKLIYTLTNGTVTIEFVKNARMSNATMLLKLRDNT